MHGVFGSGRGVVHMCGKLVQEWPAAAPQSLSYSHQPVIGSSESTVLLEQPWLDMHS